MTRPRSRNATNTACRGCAADDPGDASRPAAIAGSSGVGRRAATVPALLPISVAGAGFPRPACRSRCALARLLRRQAALCTPRRARSRGSRCRVQRRIDGGVRAISCAFLEARAAGRCTHAAPAGAAGGRQARLAGDPGRGRAGDRAVAVSVVPAALSLAARRLWLLVTRLDEPGPGSPVMRRTWMCRSAPRQDAGSRNPLERLIGERLLPRGKGPFFWLLFFGPLQGNVTRPRGRKLSSREQHSPLPAAGTEASAFEDRHHAHPTRGADRHQAAAAAALLQFLRRRGDDARAGGCEWMAGRQR